MSSSTLNFNSEYSNTHEIGNVMYTELFFIFPNIRYHTLTFNDWCNITHL